MSQIIYTQTYNINNVSMLPKGITQTQNGDFIIVGTLYKNIEHSSAFAVRIKPNGMTAWQKIYDYEYSVDFESVTETQDGNLVTIGTYSRSNTNTDQYIWITKLDTMGNILYEKIYGDNNTQNSGYDVTATKDGGFIAIGGQITTENEYTLVLKFNSNNNIDWNNKFKGATCHSIIQTKDYGYALSGIVMASEPLNSYPYILRLNQNGSKLWDKTYTDYSIFIVIRTDIIETYTNNFVIVAKSTIIETDKTGNMTWNYQNDNLNLNSIVENPYRNYVVGGSFLINNSEHAYISTIHASNKTLLSDNTEILYNSEISDMIIDKNGLPVTTGFIPYNIILYKIFLTIFNVV